MATTSNLQGWMNTVETMREAHALLEQCGFSRRDTGGGCTAWVRDFPNCQVMVTQDATAELAPEYMQEIGISVGAWDDAEGVQMYWQTMHEYESLPLMLLEAFAAATDHRGGEQ